MSDDDDKRQPEASAPPLASTTEGYIPPYYYTAGRTTLDTEQTTTQQQRPLPPLPGQSDARGLAELELMADGVRSLQLGESRGSQIETFFLNVYNLIVSIFYK